MLMETSFINFVKNKALAAEVPFGIDFEISPPTDIATTVDISGFTFPKYNELLSRESWFFEVLSSVVSAPVTNSTMLYRSLGYALLAKVDGIVDEGILRALVEHHYTRLDLAVPDKKEQLTPAVRKEVFTINEAVRWVTNPPLELAGTREYLEFEASNKGDLQELVDALKLGQSQKGVDWMKVTFFMKSRVDGEWSHSATGGLRDSQIEAICDFIALETNKGIPLETFSRLPTTEDDDEGKGSSKVPASPESTGKPKKQG